MQRIQSSKARSPVSVCLTTEVKKQILEFNYIEPANMKYSFKNYTNYRAKEQALRILTKFLDEEELKTGSPLRRTKMKIAENLKEIFSLNSSLIPSSREELIHLISEQNVLILEKGTDFGILHKPLGLVLCQQLFDINNKGEFLLSEEERNQIHYILDKTSLELKKDNITQAINYYLKTINSFKSKINSHLILIPSTPEVKQYINRLKFEYNSFKDLIAFYKKYDISNNYLTTELSDLMRQIEFEFKNVGTRIKYDFAEHKATMAEIILSSRAKSYVAGIKEERKRLKEKTEKFLNSIVLISEEKEEEFEVVFDDKNE